MNKMNQLVELWLNNSDASFKEAIKTMDDEQKQIVFGSKLEFGTAGIRGKMGPGPGQFNIYTIIESTYGYAKYLKNKFKGDITIVIGTDNRLNNDLFATTAARVLSSFGIKTVRALLTPTPLVSFAIRFLKAQGAINITASHNPPTDNGYKVYDENGSQILPEVAKAILANAADHDSYLTYDYKVNESLMQELPQSVYDEYRKQVLATSYSDNKPKQLKIVFSPQHGTASEYTSKYLRLKGYEVIDVEEQMSHDPYFSNTPSPNPESPLAYEMGIEYCQKHKADIMLTADPDADRVGVVALNEGKYKIMTGNQIAAVMFNYIVKKSQAKKPYLVYSYVSSHLPKLIAQKHNVKTYEVATGFKWIGDLIKALKNETYIFGFEESYGSLIDPSIARDKDSLQASIMIADIAEEAKTQNKTLWDLLRDIYKEYGYFNEETTTLAFEGSHAVQNRIDFMNDLRSKAKTLFDDEYKVVDMKEGKGTIAPMDLIRFSFPSGTWFGARPSGTEPKIKFYKVLVAPSQEELIKENKKINEYIEKLKKGK